MLNEPICVLDLSLRAYRVLTEGLKLRTVADVLATTPATIQAVPYAGKKTIADIRSTLASVGLTWGAPSAPDVDTATPSDNPMREYAVSPVLHAAILIQHRQMYTLANTIKVHRTTLSSLLAGSIKVTATDARVVRLATELQIPEDYAVTPWQDRQPYPLPAHFRIALDLLRIHEGEQAPRPAVDSPELVDVAEAMKLTGLHQQTLYKLGREGRVRKVRIVGGRHVRFYRQDLLQLFSER